MANRYWVGGSATWDSTAGTKWALTSGGTGGEAVPTSSDDVFFDAASGAVTVTHGSGMTCRNLDYTGFTGTTTSGGQCNIYGNLTFSNTMTMNSTGSWNFLHTSGTKTITTNGKYVQGQLGFSGSGGTTQLADDLTTYSGLTRANGAFDANGKTVTLTGVGTTHTISGSITFYNLTWSSTNQSQIRLATSITVSNVFTANASETARNHIAGYNARGSAKTITAASVSISYIDFEDITGAGAATWSGTSIGDCGGNSGITFDTPTTRYWVGNAGSWTDKANHWASVSNGSPGASIPLPQDNVVFDNYSFPSTTQTVTVDVLRMGKDITWTNVNYPIWAFGSSMRTCYGSVTLGNNMTVSGGTQSSGIRFGGHGTVTFTTNNIAFSAAVDVSIIGSSASWTLSGDLNMGSGKDFSLKGAAYTTNDNMGTVNYGSGTITSFNHNATNGAVMTVNMQSATIVANGQSMWSGTGGTTVNAGTSVLKCMYSNSGFNSFGTYTDGITFNEVWLASTSSPQRVFIGANQKIYIKTFRITNTTAKTISFDTTSNGTIAITSGGSFICTGSAGNLITLQNLNSGNNWNITKASGTVTCDYLSVRDSTASGGAEFYAGSHSTNVSGNSGWKFADNTTATVTAKGRVLQNLTKTIQSKARVLANVSKTIEAKAKMLAAYNYQIHSKASIKGVGTQTIQAKAMMSQLHTDTVDARSRIKVTGTTGGVQNVSASPGTVEDSNTPAIGTVYWNDINNVKQSDNQYSTVQLVGAQTTRWIKCTNFGFNIPSTATIVGVVAWCESFIDTSSWNLDYVRLVIAGDIKTAQNWYWSIDNYEGYDRTPWSNNNLWQETLTPAIINDSGFGVAMSTYSTSGTFNISVDHIYLQIFYTMPERNSPTIQAKADVKNTVTIGKVSELIPPTYECNALPINSGWENWGTDTWATEEIVSGQYHLYDNSGLHVDWDWGFYPVDNQRTNWFFFDEGYILEARSKTPIFASDTVLWWDYYWYDDIGLYWSIWKDWGSDEIHFSDDYHDDITVTGLDYTQYHTFKIDFRRGEAKAYCYIDDELKGVFNMLDDPARWATICSWDSDPLNNSDIEFDGGKDDVEEFEFYLDYIRIYRADTHLAGKGRIKILDQTNTVQAKGFISRLGVSENIQAKADIKNVVGTTSDAKARMKQADLTNTAQAKANLKNVVTRYTDPRGRIKVLGSDKTVQAKGRVKFTRDNTVQAKARTVYRSQKTVQTKARLKATKEATISAKSNVKNAVTRTATAKAKMWSARLGITEGNRSSQGIISGKRFDKEG